MGTVRMSSCAAKMAAAIADPFSEEARGSCFPLYPAPDSHKVTATTRLDGAIGSSGIGYILINPSVAKDATSVYYTTAAMAISATNPLTGNSDLRTGWLQTGHNGPYTASQLIRSDAEAETTLSGRVVACGLRLTYTGTTLNESGLTACLQHPTHGNLTGLFMADIQAYSQTNIGPFTRKPCTLALAPAAVAEAGYPRPSESTNTRLLYPFGADGRFHSDATDPGAVSYLNQKTVDGVTINMGAPIAVIAVTGVAGSSFHADIVYHLEYTGSAAAAASTPNSVDVSSTYAILTAASQLSTRKMAAPGQSSWKLLMDGVRAAMGSPVGVSARGILAL